MSLSKRIFFKSLSSISDGLYQNKWRNKSIFDENFWRSENLINVILKMAKDIDKYEHDHLNRGLWRMYTVYIGWKCPPKGWIKLNCDGAYKKVQDVAGCSGLLWNSYGCWIRGYTQKIGCCNASHAEMWGVCM
jgi:hypothetical protein